MKKSRTRHSLRASAELGRLKSDLDALYLRADPRLLDDDDELAGDMSRYLTLRVSGYLERAVEVILVDFCSKNAHGRVLNFSLSWLDRIPNLTGESLVKLVARFDSEVSSRLTSYLNDAERGGRLNALIGIRNDIAHGKNQGVSRDQAWQYHMVAQDVIDWLTHELVEPDVTVVASD